MEEKVSVCHDAFKMDNTFHTLTLISMITTIVRLNKVCGCFYGPFLSLYKNVVGTQVAVVDEGVTACNSDSGVEQHESAAT